MNKENYEAELMRRVTEHFGGRQPKNKKELIEVYDKIQGEMATERCLDLVTKVNGDRDER